MKKISLLLLIIAMCSCASNRKISKVHAGRKIEILKSHEIADVEFQRGKFYYCFYFHDIATNNPQLHFVRLKMRQFKFITEEQKFAQIH